MRNCRLLTFLSTAVWMCFLNLIQCDYETYPLYFWHTYCGKLLNLPCSGGQLAASTTSNALWIKNCTVVITLNLAHTSCRSYSDTEHAIYFHIKQVKRNESASVTIYEGSELLKNISGHYISNTSQVFRTAAQVLSHYRLQPNFIVKFENFTDSDTNLTNSTGIPMIRRQEFTVDFIGLIKEATIYEQKKCPALDGYTKEDYLCESNINRVNCPESYNKTIGPDNPVEKRYPCPRVTTPYYYRPTTPYYWTERPYTYAPYPPYPNYYYDDGMATWAIMLIVVSVILILFGIIVGIARKNARNRAMCEAPRLTYVPNSSGNPVTGFSSANLVTGNAWSAPPYPAAPANSDPVIVSPRPFLDAPPTYNVVMANPS